jgi:hypothetical protein
MSWRTGRTLAILGAWSGDARQHSRAGFGDFALGVISGIRRYSVFGAVYLCNASIRCALASDSGPNFDGSLPGPCTGSRQIGHSWEWEAPWDAAAGAVVIISLTDPSTAAAAINNTPGPGCFRNFGIGGFPYEQ